MAASHPIDRRYVWKDHPKHPGVYSITHADSERRYIGSARNIYHRWREHRSMLRRGVHHSPYLQNAWNKHGEKAFRFEVLEACLGDAVLLCAREQCWLDRHKGKLFNARKHSEAAFGVPRTPEQRKHVSQRMMGNKNGYGTHYHGKFVEDNIKDILFRYAAGEHRSTLAAEYKTDETHISRIASRRIWWRVEVPPEIDAACRERTKHRSRGPRNPKSKLHSRISEIKQRLAGGESGASIARDLGVSPAAISSIKNGKNYGYL